MTPIACYWQKKTINERGIIQNPDLVIVADESLPALAVAAVLPGLTSHSVLLIQTDHSAATLKNQLHIKGEVLVLLPSRDEKITGGMAFKLEPYSYLRYLFEKLPITQVHDLRNLLPTNLKPEDLVLPDIVSGV